MEFIRQFRRRRTLVTHGLVGLAAGGGGTLPSGSVPRPDGDSDGRRFGGGSLDLVGLATSGAANFTVTMLFFATSFLLILVTSVFLGTPWPEKRRGTLRYLLAAPVPRRRLLVVKLAVGLVSTLVGIVLLVVTSYVIGLVAFGSGPLASPAGDCSRTARCCGASPPWPGTCS